ncbi:MAG: hypothetical protein Q4C80_01295 [Bacillota bacterium]|nr:hypothetical protein [Bacillota bacterium]
MKKSFLTKSVVAALCIFVVILTIIWTGNHLSDTYSKESLRQTEDTVRRFAVQCYALEGEYPKSIDYLADNYALTLNEDDYIYHYTYIGDNMMPDITVLPAQ